MLLEITPLIKTLKVKSTQEGAGAAHCSRIIPCLFVSVGSNPVVDPVNAVKGTTTVTGEMCP